MKKILKTIIFFLIFTLSVQILLAQPLPPTPRPIPLDSFLFALIIAGFSFAAKKFYKKYDKNN